MSNPPFTITSKVLNLCSKISRVLGRCEGLQLSAPSPQLRRQNRIRSIQSSLAIEGNILTQEQISAIIDHKRVIGPAKDIREVQNAIEVYAKIKDYDPYSIKSFLAAHQLLMRGLSADAGQFRRSGVGVMQGAKVVHMAPPAGRVPQLMAGLFVFLKNAGDSHVFIRSCVFHYEAEFIHPFGDGNGRMGRLWQSVILTRAHPVFECIPVESLVRQRQKEYYRVLRLCDQKGDSTLFVEFMLEALNDAVEEFVADLKEITSTPYSRLDTARRFFGAKTFSRNDYMRFHKTVSSATASRDLSLGVSEKTLRRRGTKALSKYVFVS